MKDYEPCGKKGPLDTGTGVTALDFLWCPAVLWPCFCECFLSRVTLPLVLVLLELSEDLSVTPWHACGVWLLCAEGQPARYRGKRKQISSN